MNRRQLSTEQRSSLNRRDILKATAAASAGYWIGGSTLSAADDKSPNEKLNVACIGIGGRGGANVGGVRGENIVAMCDVDDKRAGKAYSSNAKAKKFYDYRKMFDTMANEIDAVVISTPDHTHFHPAMLAMDLGKHVYCEKPMAHNVWQVRQMTEKAREKNLATQLGNQRHAMDNMRRVVELVRAGAIGDVTEVHSWIGGSRGMPKIPTDTPPVPDGLKWDLWLGQAPERPYHSSICPYGWRFWWDYGTGETGNWGCHILDIPFWALELDYPTSVEASGPEIHALTTPKSMATKFAFPAKGKRGPITLHWYHGSGANEALKKYDLSTRGGNTVFIGTEGQLVAGFSSHKLFPEKKFADYKRPEASIPKSPGFHREWIQACKGGEPATCNFDYTGPMAETVLLGNVAYRAGGEAFQWDAKTLTASGNSKVAQYIKEPVRKGWEV